MSTFAVMKSKVDLKVLSWGILGVLTLIWGSSFILIKRGLESFSPDQVGCIRIIAAATFLLPVSLSNLRGYSRKNLGWLLSVGMVGSFIPAFLFATAQMHLTSSLAGILNALTPMFTFIVGVLLFKQPVRIRIILGLLTAFAGCTLLIASGADGFGNVNYYALLIVLATLCYGTNVNIIKYRLAGITAPFITAASLLLVLPMALIYLFGFTPFTEVLQTEEGAYTSLGYLVLLGVMGTSVALMLFNWLVQLTNPVFTSVVTYMMPIVALMWGFLDGEIILMIHVIGLLTIVAGVYLINSGQRQIYSAGGQPITK